jgi:hypothetical protein
MSDMRKVFDDMMADNASADEDDDFVQNLEKDMSTGDEGENSLTKEQADYLNFCRALANGVPSLITESPILTKIQQLVSGIEKKYADRTIFFIIDMFKRSSNCSQSTRTAMTDVPCTITASRIPQLDSVVFKCTIPELNTTRNFYVHKQYAPLIYALIYIIRFQDCVVKKIKDPTTDDLDFNQYFATLEKTIRYVTYHLPC